MPTSRSRRPNVLVTFNVPGARDEMAVRGVSWNVQVEASDVHRLRNMPAGALVVFKADGGDLWNETDWSALEQGDGLPILLSSTDRRGVARSRVIETLAHGGRVKFAVTGWSFVVEVFGTTRSVRGDYWGLESYFVSCTPISEVRGGKALTAGEIVKVISPATYAPNVGTYEDHEPFAQDFWVRILGDGGGGVISYESQAHMASRALRLSMRQTNAIKLDSAAFIGGEAWKVSNITSDGSWGGNMIVTVVKNVNATAYNEVSEPPGGARDMSAYPPARTAVRQG